VVGTGAVWAVDTGAGVLWALDPATGDGIAHVAIGDVPHFASPTLVAAGGLAVVGTMSGIVAVRVGG
jgi:polyvinyl alcohol dehydrogenase (cytochrome)